MNILVSHDSYDTSTMRILVNLLARLRRIRNERGVDDVKLGGQLTEAIDIVCDGIIAEMRAQQELEAQRVNAAQPSEAEPIQAPK